MNFFQSLNIGIFGLTLAAVFGGLNKLQNPLDQTPATIWMFVAFVILLRLKMCLDDHKYFGSADRKTLGFKIGFFIGVASWIMWILSAWMISDLRAAYYLAGIAIAVSLIWIVVSALRSGGLYREQYFWLCSNAAYIILLWAAYIRDTVQKDGVTWGVLTAALALAVVDILFSKSVHETG
jgi:hypothetical protein